MNLKNKPDLDYKHLTLIGHSNGGDMAALFGNQHPNLVYKIITMDNRRMFLPRTSIPKIYSLRSNDYPADEGVLPGEEEQKKYQMTVQAINQP
jgi:predicted esterase